jgi:hypothetical protein
VSIILAACVNCSVVSDRFSGVVSIKRFEKLQHKNIFVAAGWEFGYNIGYNKKM